MEPVTSVTDRIQQIQSRITGISAPGRPSSPLAALGTAPTSGSASAVAFAEVLGQEAETADLPRTWVLNPPPTMMPATSFAPAMTWPGTAPGSAPPAAGGSGPAVAGVDGISGVTPGVGTGRDLVNAKGIPLELLAYGNGRIPADALSPIGGGNGHRLWTPAARSFEALRAAAAQDGVTVGITDSYRSFEAQVDVARRKGLYSQGGLAAVPGTSNHGWGLSLDLRLDAPAQGWMRQNAGRYGFVEDVPREPWHWTYRPTS
jgi:zinc D-Ala-D-Ala carboxypeptidase